MGRNFYRLSNLITLIALAPVRLAGIYLLNFRMYEMFAMGVIGGVVCLTNAMWPVIRPPTTAYRELLETSA